MSLLGDQITKKLCIYQAVTLAGSHNFTSSSARHKRAHPALAPTSKPGTWFTYPGGM